MYGLFICANGNDSANNNHTIIGNGAGFLTANGATYAIHFYFIEYEQVEFFFFILKKISIFSEHAVKEIFELVAS